VNNVRCKSVEVSGRGRGNITEIKINELETDIEKKNMSII
jgi:hypothetical protein